MSCLLTSATPRARHSSAHPRGPLRSSPGGAGRGDSAERARPGSHPRSAQRPPAGPRPSASSPAPHRARPPPAPTAARPPARRHGKQAPTRALSLGSPCSKRGPSPLPAARPLPAISGQNIQLSPPLEIAFALGRRGAHGLGGPQRAAAVRMRPCPETPHSPPGPPRRVGLSVTKI